MKEEPQVFARNRFFLVRLPYNFGLVVCWLVTFNNPVQKFIQILVIDFSSSTRRAEWSAYSQKICHTLLANP